MPSQKKVLSAAKSQSIDELPDDFGSWDSFVEEDEVLNLSKEYADLEKELKKYYGKTLINFKVDSWPPERLYKKDKFSSRILDKPIQYKHRGKSLLLSLYRTDSLRLPFKIDSASIELINESVKKNSSAWLRYSSTKEGRYSYCSLETFYNLLKGCV